MVRVVIDLAGRGSLQLSHDGRALVVDFNEQPAAPGATAKAATMTSNSSRGEFRCSSACSADSSGDQMPNYGISLARFALPGELTQPSFGVASYGGKSEPARPTASGTGSATGDPPG